MNTYLRTALTGGTATSLDNISVDDLDDGDTALVVVATKEYWYIFVAAATDAEDSPTYIRPDDYASSGVWYRVTDLESVLGAPPSGVYFEGGISGFDATQNASDADHDIDFAAGACLDSTGSVAIKTSTGMTKRLDAVWAAGDGEGGRIGDATATFGVDNNDWVDLYVVCKDTDGSVDFVIDIDDYIATWAAGSGYSSYRYLYSIPLVSKTDLCTFWANGDLVIFQVASEHVLTQNITTTYATVAMTAYINTDRLKEIWYGARDATASGNVIISTQDGTNTECIIGATAATVTDGSADVWGSDTHQLSGFIPYNSARKFKSSAGTLDLLCHGVRFRR